MLFSPLLIAGLLARQSYGIGLPEFVNPHLGVGRLGAVASESSICSQAGTKILQKGGNAADAMIATVLCVGTVGMHHSGIGGGGFALVHDKDGSFEFIDFRETAPSAASQDMYDVNANLSIYGGLASGVPGQLRGLEHIHTKYGVLPWNSLVQPSIQLARYGFQVTQDLVANMIKATTGTEDFLTQNPSWAIDFAPNGTRLGLGDTMTRRRNYTVAIREPLQIDYRGWKITSTSAPSSGPVTLSTLKIVEGYDDFFSPGMTNLSTHRMDEAMRFAYGQRTLLGDPSFVQGVDEYQKRMISDNTSREICSRISDFHTQDVSAYDPDNIDIINTPGTSHIVSADYSGMAVSLTTTINLAFGSHVIVPETGVIMNNEMNATSDFSIPNVDNAFGYVPQASNYIKPGKRPLSSITPTIVTHPNGTLYFVVGAAGGSRITTATIQSLIHALDQDMPPHEALAQPRLHDQLIPNQVTFDWGYDNRTVNYMCSLGHNATWVAQGQSQVQALRRLPNGTFEAAGEPRQVNSGGFAV
ncbi:Gamma-glutamyltransferase [Penicillium waksmanii]|uniref:Gamma-glutamyltransferase n=1 Tax=Penicillium waksmanii TaxID=69791 RepID=UPI002548E664|nr:Gamma-glutamyltransferase [Penicillium waksmanii]KAJ6000862.1 Gamma-glutamyltransferase [Penicillium waksmanii]